MAKQDDLTKDLTKRQIGQIRANLARKLSCIGDRVVRNALGELTNPQGDPIELTKSQLDSCKLILQNVLPAMQSVQMEDITEDKPDKAQLQAAYNQAIEQIKSQLKPDDIRETLLSMPADTRQALLDSLTADIQ